MLRNCSKDTLYGKADDKLSQISSLLVQLAKMESESWDESVAYGAPSECWALIQKCFEKHKKYIFINANMDETEYLAAVRERTSERWVYYNLPF